MHSSPLHPPKQIAMIGDQLALAWTDGTEQYLSLRTLRRACPCAACMGEPDVMGNKLSLEKKKYTAESSLLKKYEFVGAYALQFFWGDGHSSGIYTFEYLKNGLFDQRYD